MRSTQATVYRERRSAATSRAMVSSRSRVRSVSTTIHGVSTRRSASSAATTTPVRPMPPAVAQKALGVAVRREAQELARGGDELQPQHVLAEAAVAMVVLAVHVRGHRAADRHLAGAGGDGREPRRAGSTRRMSAPMLSPAPTVMRPRSGSKACHPSRALPMTIRPPAFWAASP